MTMTEPGELCDEDLLERAHQLRLLALLITSTLAGRLTFTSVNFDADFGVERR